MNFELFHFTRTVFNYTFETGIIRFSCDTLNYYIIKSLLSEMNTISTLVSKMIWNDATIPFYNIRLIY